MSRDEERWSASSSSDAVQPVWMSGFHHHRRALSLRDQQLSCQFCFRSVDPPSCLPRISMLRQPSGRGREREVEGGKEGDRDKAIIGLFGTG